MQIVNGLTEQFFLVGTNYFTIVVEALLLTLGIAENP